MRDHWPDQTRPRTRGECVDGPRPCPWVGCKHHLYIRSVRANTLVTHDCEPWELDETCSLDVADRGGQDVAEIARLMGVTKQMADGDRVRGLARIRRSMSGAARKLLRQLWEEGAEWTGEHPLAMARRLDGQDEIELERSEAKRQRQRRWRDKASRMAGEGCEAG